LTTLALSSKYRIITATAYLKADGTAIIFRDLFGSLQITMLLLMSISIFWIRLKWWYDLELHDLVAFP